jgi:hypothetical protein
MRVLNKGRTALLLAVIAGITAVALPASAGVTARAVVPAGEVTTRAAVVAGHAVRAHVVAPRATMGVVLGPAVAYVREPDGTIRRYR